MRAEVIKNLRCRCRKKSKIARERRGNNENAVIYNNFRGSLPRRCGAGTVDKETGATVWREPLEKNARPKKQTAGKTAKEQSKMTVTRITYDFFKKSGVVSHLVRTESVEVEGISKAELMKKDGSDIKKRYQLVILTSMKVTPEEWEEYDYHTISFNEREQEDEEEEGEDEE